jgi:uncharacterized protein (DUF2141 family)
MKTLFYFILAASSLFRGTYEPTSGVTVTVTLENVLNDEGEILAALHTKATFMKGPGVNNYKTEAKKGTLTFIFDNVTPGTYAISVLHDLNSNQRMDFQPGGMPKEPYAMSGNDMSMGPPSFESAAFQVGEDPVQLRIRF